MPISICCIYFFIFINNAEISIFLDKPCSHSDYFRYISEIYIYIYIYIFRLLIYTPLRIVSMHLTLPSLSIPFSFLLIWLNNFYFLLMISKNVNEPIAIRFSTVRDWLFMFWAKLSIGIVMFFLTLNELFIFKDINNLPYLWYLFQILCLLILCFWHTEVLKSLFSHVYPYF